MTEAALEKGVCASCGTDVRERTQFCYACGEPLSANLNTTDEPDIERQPISKHDEPDVSVVGEAPLVDSKSERLASAAAQRKRSRSGMRKPKQVVWEEPGIASNRIFVLVCILIFVIAAAVVSLTVFIK